MKISLKNKTALVTAATNGMGFSIAKGLLEAGADLFITGRDQYKLDNAINELKKHMPEANIFGLAFNAATAEGCRKIINSLPEVDILINNLGIYEICEFENISDDQWIEMFETNVMSGVRLSRHYMLPMKAKGWGRIQFISSESAFNIPSEMVHYGMSKSALQGVSRGLAKALKETGVTVNTILPGPTKTDGVISLLKNNFIDEHGVFNFIEGEKNFFKTYRNSSIIQRFIEPEEIANMVVFISSNQASATTGAAIRVEGGIIDSIH